MKYFTKFRKSDNVWYSSTLKLVVATEPSPILGFKVLEGRMCSRTWRWSFMSIIRWNLKGNNSLLGYREGWKSIEWIWRGKWKSWMIIIRDKKHGKRTRIVLTKCFLFNSLYSFITLTSFLYLANWGLFPNKPLHVSPIWDQSFIADSPHTYNRI